MTEFEKVANFDELGEGELYPADCGEMSVVLIKLNGRVFALEDRCPHRGAQLSEGSLEGQLIRCPWHGALIDPATGYASPPSREHAHCLDVRIAEDGAVEVRS
jgi:nitrite reductase/ring-hydroxylating ferredoxin subunit